MANGRGTWDCHDCKYYYFEEPESPSPDGSRGAHCRLWRIRLPREQYGTDNLICMDYTTVEGYVLPDRLTLTLRRAVLYAFFYNVDLYDPREYRPVQELVGTC